MCAFSGTVGVIGMEVMGPPFTTDNMLNPVALFSALHAVSEVDPEGWFDPGMTYVRRAGDSMWVPHGRGNDDNRSRGHPCRHHPPALLWVHAHAEGRASAIPSQSHVRHAAEAGEVA